MPNRNLQAIVAGNIRRIRLEIGLSQEKLAEQAGLHRTYIGGVERGERNITLSSLERIARALHTTPTQLISAKASHDV